MPPYPVNFFVFLIDKGFPCFGQSGLKLLASNDPPTLASQSAGIAGVSHRTQPTPAFINKWHDHPSRHLKSSLTDTPGPLSPSAPTTSRFLWILPLGSLTYFLLACPLPMPTTTPTPASPLAQMLRQPPQWSPCHQLPSSHSVLPQQPGQPSKCGSVGTLPA